MEATPAKPTKIPLNVSRHQVDVPEHQRMSGRPCREDRRSPFHCSTAVLLLFPTKIVIYERFDTSANRGEQF